MNRRTVVGAGIAALVLSACSYNRGPAFAANRSSGGARVYRITPTLEQRIPFRVLDAINAVRGGQSLQPVAFNASLDAAALTHSRDMSVQNRPWHFGSDGSSPLLRVQRIGYTGVFLGELISETFETEIETLSAWMRDPNTRAVILDPNAREIGFSWFQEDSGKIWWTLLTGG